MRFAAAWRFEDRTIPLMPSLHPDLRKLLEKKIVAARDAAEAAARAALSVLAVTAPAPYASLSAEQRTLRVRLRAVLKRLRNAGDRDDESAFESLVGECAYEQWHRMLFARFLSENHLLRHPGGAIVTLSDCAELADTEGEPDGWMTAARYASAMLPGIFRLDDPVLQVRFAPEGRLALEALLNDLPAPVFTAEDSLGWTYQFWQTKRKAEVNRGGRKIGGSDLPPVTQLFTEDYMVEFLLHNSLGAWWVSRHSGDPYPCDLAYLRLNEDGTPAAGGFPGWPDRVADLKVMDPCCGSGHFLVTAFEVLRRMRMAEEGLPAAAAGDAVIRDNLHGLEIDARCVQIAAFALALAAWKTGGYRDLPLPNLSCSGLAVGSSEGEWTRLAKGDVDLEDALRRLYELFRQAPDLGSLIDPAAEVGQGLFRQDWEEVACLLEGVLAREKDDPVGEVFGAAARGVSRAAGLLAGRYHLVATNVPYLSRGGQDDILREFCLKRHPNAKADLATVFVDRCLAFCTEGGTPAIVTPQNWLFLGSYKHLREEMLKE